VRKWDWVRLECGGDGGRFGFGVGARADRGVRPTFGCDDIDLIGREGWCLPTVIVAQWMTESGE
jgi:hypothetical protein